MAGVGGGAVNKMFFGSLNLANIVGTQYEVQFVHFLRVICTVASCEQELQIT